MSKDFMQVQLPPKHVRKLCHNKRRLDRYSHINKIIFTIRQNPPICPDVTLL